MTNNIQEAMDALETALRILDSGTLNEDKNNLSSSSIVYLNGVTAAIRVALEKLEG